MIDTLMVVWTRGIWKRLLRNISIFMLFCAGICVILFLIMTSGKQWTGLAFTVARSSTSSQTNSSVSSAPTDTTAQPVATAYSTAQPFIQPVVLKNPVPADTHHKISAPKHISYSTPVPLDNSQPIRPKHSNPSPSTNPDDPTNILQNLP